MCMNIPCIRTKIEKRVQIFGDNNVNQFSAILLQLENGNVPETEGEMLIKNTNLCTNINSLQDLFKKFYPDTQKILTKSLTWFQECAILKSKN